MFASQLNETLLNSLKPGMVFNGFRKFYRRMRRTNTDTVVYKLCLIFHGWYATKVVFVLNVLLRTSPTYN